MMFGYNVGTDLIHMIAHVLNRTDVF